MGRCPIIQMPDATDMPLALFVRTRDERLGLARERFFEEGERPTRDIVPEAVIQSWIRCIGAGKTPRHVPYLEPVTKSRINMALQRNYALLQAAEPELQNLDEILRYTGARAALVDMRSVVLRITPGSLTDGSLTRASCRVGVSLDEFAIGTGSPSLAVSTGNLCAVRGAEHFYDSMAPLHCVGEPIRNHRGLVVGTLNIGLEGRPFPFDAVGVLKVVATTIENRLLKSHAGNHAVIRFQSHPSLLGTAMEGMAGVDEDGEIVWLNQAGARLLALSDSALPRMPLGLTTGEVGMESTERMFGLRLDVFHRFVEKDCPVALRMPSGVQLWMQASLCTRAGEGKAKPVIWSEEVRTMDSVAQAAISTGRSIEDASRELIQTTLLQYKGNISRAAKALGVSRGFLYRRLGQEEHC